MGRTLALSAVVDAITSALNVASIRTLCPGGVYRSMPVAQSLPYLSVGDRCTERPWNAAGTNYGSEVSVSVRVETSGADADGHKRAVTILSAALLLRLRIRMNFFRYRFLHCVFHMLFTWILVFIVLVFHITHHFLHVYLNYL